MRDLIIKAILRIANKIKTTPVVYGCVNNIDYYSKEFLRSYDQSKTLKEFFKDMDKMEKCMKSGENCLIQDGIVYKDIHLEDHL